MATHYGMTWDALKMYTEAMRRLIRDRLKATYADDWWTSGVMGRLTPAQQDNMAKSIESDSRSDLSEYLDANLFPGVILRNYSAAFQSVFPDYGATRDRLHVIGDARNNVLAHPRTGELNQWRAREVLDAMRRLLADAGLPEAVGVQEIIDRMATQEKPVQAGQAKLPTPERSEVHPVPNNAIQSPEQANGAEEDLSLFGQDALSATSLWRKLRDYLAVDMRVADAKDSDNQVRLFIRVTNTAPSGTGWPEIVFDNVGVQFSIGGSTRSSRSGTLTNGQSQVEEFAVSKNSLAAVKYQVSGKVNLDRMFTLQQTGTVPLEYTRPIISRYLQAFEGLKVEDCLNEAIEAVKHLSPSTTLAEIAALKMTITGVMARCKKEQNQLQQVSHDAPMQQDTAPSRHLQSAFLFLGNVAKASGLLLDAVSKAAPPDIDTAVAGLTALRVDAIRLRDATSDLAKIFQLT